MAAWLTAGYASIFVVSILGNLIPFIPVPYLAAVYFYSLKMPDANPLIVGLVSGFGGALGKLIVYTLGRGSRILLTKESAERYERLGKMLRCYGALAAFLFAATPSPDDAVVIPLGLMKYDALKLFLGLATGKIAISTVTAYTGRAVASITGYELVLELVASIVLFAIVILLLVYLNWEGVFEVLSERGVSGLFAKIKSEGSSFLLRPRRRSNGNR